MSQKTRKLHLNVNYSDEETFNNVLKGDDENYQIIDDMYVNLLNAIGAVNIAFSESVDLENSRLPKEYQEVEYLRNDSDGYLNTEYIPNINTSLQIKFMCTSTLSNEQDIFGQSHNYSRFMISIQDSSGQMYCRYHAVNGSNVIILYINNYVNKLQEMTFGNGYIIYEGQRYISASMSSVENETIYLFKPNSPSYSQSFKGNIYYVKIYSGNELIRDYIPCYRKEDSKPGLYDLITETFLQGIANITAGPDIN